MRPSTAVKPIVVATLRLTTDLGSVNIVPLEAGAAPVVRYTVHIETDARGPAALTMHLLEYLRLLKPGV